MPHLVAVGHSGQVATALRHAALPAGWTLACLGREALDLTEPETFAAALVAARPDILINAAAYTAVDRAEDEEELATRVNGDAPGRLAALAEQGGIPFLHVSTDFVFDGRPGRPWREDDDPAPLNAYGRSKLAGEEAVRQATERAVILRTSWVFGQVGSNFVRTILRLAAARDELTIVADQTGGPTPADDIAAALIRLAVAIYDAPLADRFGTFHYCGRPAVTWADFAEAIVSRAAWIERKPAIRRITSEEYRAPARRPANSVLDCSRIEQVFGIRQPDWRDGLARTLAALNPRETTQ